MSYQDRAINKERTYRKKARLRISFQITAIGLAILMIAGAASLVALRSSLDQLTKNSKEKVIEAVADMISSSHGYVSGLMLDIQAKEAVPMNSSGFFRQVESAIQDESITPSQQSGGELLARMVDKGMLGLDVMYYAFTPKAGVNSKPVVVVSSDDEYMYSEVPDEVADIAEKNQEYKLFEDGIPDMGLSEEYLVTTYKLDNPAGVLWFFDFKPMGELITGIDAFFNKEKRNVYLSLLVVMIFTAIGLFIISFLILGYLINRRISRPVDELSEAAENVMEGDLDTRVAIRRSDEFSTLKHVFNMMISILSVIIARAAGETPVDENSDYGEKQKEAEIPSGKPRRRSTILLQITSLFAVLFITAGTLSVFMINRSIDNLVENSKEKLIETDAELVSSSHDFVFELIMMKSAKLEQYAVEETADIYRKLANRDPEIIPMLVEMSEEIRKMIEYGLFGFTFVYDVAPPTPGLIEEAFVLMSSENTYILKEPAGEILKMMNIGKDSWKLFKNGIPDMGFNEEYLVTTYIYQMPGTPSKLWSVDFKPMGEEMESIDSFFNGEKTSLNLVFGITTGISILLTILLIFLVLGYLLRKKITEPVDELTAAAEEVIEGNFDVEVKVRSGEELENLKRTFNAMVKSFRDLIEKSSAD